MSSCFATVTAPPGRREDWILNDNDERIAGLPPTMARCYKIWSGMERRVHHWSNSKGGSPQFLAFFSKCVTMPCYPRDQLFPFYAYFGNVDDVLNAAKHYDIYKKCRQLYNELSVWAQDTRCNVRTYALNSDRYRIELCILWGMKPILANERLLIGQTIEALSHDVMNFQSQSLPLYNKLNTLDVISARLNNAIAILKYIRVEHRQNPDNLLDHGLPQSTFRYEDTNKLHRQMLWRITNDVEEQELSELSVQTGLQRDLQVQSDHPIVMARFHLYHKLFRPLLTVSIITTVRNSLMGLSS